MHTRKKQTMKHNKQTKKNFPKKKLKKNKKTNGKANAKNIKKKKKKKNNWKMNNNSIDENTTVLPNLLISPKSEIVRLEYPPIVLSSFGFQWSWK